MTVTEAGRPRGIVVRGSVSARDAERPVTEVMSAALTVGPQVTVDEACALMLAHAEPLPGLVVVEAGQYRGVIAARALLRLKCDGGSDRQDEQRCAELLGGELRAPLDGVLAVAEMLQRQPLSADGQAFVRTIVESCQAP